MKSTEERPIIGITMGDPVGIGPEIISKALTQGSVYETCRPLILGDVAAITASRFALWVPLRPGFTSQAVSM
jgi:4-hydroxy-L-threonine phosphate dehydrogenase PdxA